MYVYKIKFMLNVKQILIELDKKFFNYKLSSAYFKYFKKELSAITLDISGICNLNCETCSLKKWYKNHGIMPFKTVKKLNQLFRKIDYIDLQCNAEPFLNKNILQIIQYIKKVNKKILVSLVTNGMLLNRNLISGLLESGINKILVSVDGATKESFEKIRRGAEFYRVINNIKKLIKQRNSNKDRLKEIGIITVATKENVAELIDILEITHDLGADSLTINGLEPYSKKMAEKILYSGRSNTSYKKIFSVLKKRAVRYNIKLSLPSLKIIPAKTCVFHSLQGCTIEWNGDVHPCGTLSYKRPYYYLGKKLIHPEITFGNINNEDTFDIWNSKEYRTFRKMASKGKLPLYCKNCLMNHQVICPI